MSISNNAHWLYSVDNEILILTDKRMTELDRTSKEYLSDSENFITKDQLEHALQLSFSSDILADPEGWTPEYAAFGHCSAAAQIVHDIFGGEIHGYWFAEEAQNWGGYVRGSHFLNVLPDGSRFDSTKSQFPEEFPYDEIMDPEKGVAVDRSIVFDNAGSAGQYARLRTAVLHHLWQSFGIKADYLF